MGGSIEFQETNRLMPVSVLFTAVTGTSVPVEIPAGWAGAYVSLRASGGDVWFLPGDASVEVDPADSDPALIGWMIAPDSTEDWRIPPGCTHLAVATTDCDVSLRWALTSDPSGVRGTTT